MVLGALAALAIASCSKAGGGGSPGKLGGAAQAAPDVIPKDASMVLGFSWDKIRENKYFKTFMEEKLPEKAKGLLTALKSSCGIDPVGDLNSLVIAGGADMDKTRVVVVVKGNWTEDKFVECAGKFSYEDKKASVAKDGNITTYTVEGKPPVSVAWIAKDTLVTTISALEGDKSYLSDLLKQKGTLKDNTPVMDLMGKIDSSNTFWMAAQATGPMSMMGQQLTAGTNAKLAGIWLSLDYVKDLSLNMGMRLDSDAKPVADKMSKEFDQVKKNPQFGEFLKDASVDASGNDVVVKVAMSEKQVDQLIEMVKQLLPMIMGGMLGGH
jgi:hypothetical protein